jgi:hypothetical protein
VLVSDAILVTALKLAEASEQFESTVDWFPNPHNTKLKRFWSSQHSAQEEGANMLAAWGRTF